MSEKKYTAILNKLSLEQKASLCSGETFWLTKEIEEFDIPAVWMADGPNGIRKEILTKSTNAMRDSEPATCFPPAVTTASTWNTELVEEIGDAISREAKSLGVTTVLGPGVNIKRSPLCGRNFEYFSEDPFLAGHMGAAWVHGVQKNNIGTSLKHFAANNQERLRMCIDTLVDERALREIYLPAFEHIVKTEKPTTIMSSYNLLNGTFLSDNKRMQTDILRDEWGFEGIVISDWGATNDRVEGIKAGLDLEMPGNNGINNALIVKAVKDGSLSEEALNKVALRMIKFAFECREKEVEGFEADFETDNEVCHRAASEGAVLLKNTDRALPVKKDEKIAVIGAFAKKTRYQGGGSSHIHATKIVSFTDACDAAGQAYEYAEGYTMKGDGYSARLIRQACRAAVGKDKVLVFVGLTDEYESEGYDRVHINLPSAHNLLISKLLEVNPNVIVMLSGGSPMKIDEWEPNVKAILNLYLGGQAGGAAAYDLIFGNVNPSGKLAETFPLRNNDNVVARNFPMGPRNVQYRESIYVGYRFFDAIEKPVQYPFGFGLSYTSFEYSGLKLSSKKINEGEELSVTFDVKNIGDVAGAEIAELYVSDVESTIFRPKKELKGFKKVFLQPGEKKKITLTLDARAFSYYNVAISDWHIESGDFEILIGASSRDIKLSDRVYVTSANPMATIPDYRGTAPIYYDMKGVESGKQNVPVEQFRALYGADFVENRPYKRGELHKNNSVLQVAISPWGKILYAGMMFGGKISSIGTTNKKMILLTLKDMPLRAYPGYTGGIVSHEALEGLVGLCNRERGAFHKFMKGLNFKATPSTMLADTRKPKKTKEEREQERLIREQEKEQDRIAKEQEKLAKQEQKEQLKK